MVLKKRIRDIDVFSFKGAVFNGARLVKVYDGDTITILAPVGPKNALRRLNCRLAGVNASETTGSDKDEGANAKLFLLSKLGIASAGVSASTDFDEAFFEETPHFVDVRCHKFEKYGRVLVDVAPQGAKYVNSSLCENSNFTPYMTEKL
jgi:hypothetical protein